MKKALNNFESKEPLLVFNWKDSESEAEGWTVINSLRGDAAGGGTQMKKGLNMKEVLYSAKMMEMKFSVSGPSIGGAKSGINFDPNDPRKNDVLKRWYKVISPLLKSYYGTYGDFNVDDINEVVPITEECGIWHPQEGISNGHFKHTEADKINRIGQLRHGVLKIIENSKFSPDVSKKYTISEMINGFGIAEAIRHYYTLYGGELKGKKVIIQGFGSVGAATSFYLTSLGAKIIGIIDSEGGLINEQGFSMEEIRVLFLTKDANKLVSKNKIPLELINEKIWTIGAEIFAPCSTSEKITQNQIELLVLNGLEIISCGVNMPFADSAVFYGPIMENVDNKVSLLPYFISNCGMVRLFAYFMQKEVKMDDETIFNDISQTIKDAIMKVYTLNTSKTNISACAFEIALKKLDLVQTQY
ncbi:glutamate dehydrogenase/leucine dehydrogenase [Flavobacterium sp. HSC-32F16]|uniref:Glu/Leu/Phe/Val dehydrogenase dimerization domain-containing protein n=1 Tax=Flavobacterium sp. HSC-32F16 TaxID=2910964 RepID=UPI0020A3C8A6|nr:Glu/Leu/Phe/Val dehydrogenase dimerization domain-containing protein [Flavobacterium sp. HSC-32F16]MCP2028479.1 glutamate dehydrogenase/leucine dehydrogenase [Flavobacterium sp. HSC-32F16]